MRFFIITGRRHIGKTTFLQRLIKELKKNYTVGGLLTTGVKDKEFINIQTRETCRYYQKNDKIKEKIGDYIISERAINFAEKAIEESVNYQVIIIDEFGRLERDGRGLLKSIQKLVETIRNNRNVTLLMTIQIDVVEKAKEILKLKPERIITLERESKHEEEIKKCINLLKNSFMREGGL